ncbi:YbgC/FadM family acyl-CoA thioesterase [Plastoroseomonas arctica]|nr:YbgC/FadM family acyl-CoA thioesterase [Plastoroseomonas arctica]
MTVMESPPHQFPIRVYFEDTDAGGMAYHASHLRWAERARTESLRDAGHPHQGMIDGHNALLVVRRVEVEYWRPARLDDSLVVETRIRRVTPVQLVLDQRVLRDGERLAALVVGLVCVDRDKLSPRPIPEPWRTLFRQGVHETPKAAQTAPS